MSKYEIFVDRADGNGLSSDGCWGGENNDFGDDESAVRDAVTILAEVYQDVDWIVTEDGYEVFRIEATEVEE